MKLPKSIRGLGGKIRVTTVNEPYSADARRPNAGAYHEAKRLIEVRKGMPNKFTHMVLYHEWMHSVLIDSGLNNLFTERQHEALCDAVGNARALELLG